MVDGLLFGVGAAGADDERERGAQPPEAPARSLVRAPAGRYQLGVARPTEDEIDRAVAETCAARNLQGDDVFLVASLVERPRSAWPACCESGCDPCIKDVVCAADIVRARLGLDRG